MDSFSELSYIAGDRRWIWNRSEQTMSSKALISVAVLSCAVVIAALVPLAFTKERGPAIKPVTSLATFDHDPNAFSQGLVVENGKMWEGTGQYGKSELRQIELETGKVLANAPLGQEYFGEGITLLDNKIYQLTWKENICFVYDATTLKPLTKFTYSGEGWGLTNDGKYCI